MWVKFNEFIDDVLKNAKRYSLLSVLLALLLCTTAVLLGIWQIGAVGVTVTILAVILVMYSI